MTIEQLDAYNRLQNLRAAVDRISRVCRHCPTVANWQALDEAHAAVDRVTAELYAIARDEAMT